MSDVMTSEFFYSPEYRTQCVQLNAQASAVPQGTIICIEASSALSAAFTGTEAALTGDAQNYTPAGTVAISGGASQADGSFDVIGTGAYNRVYGVLLKDVAASGSSQPVDVIVGGQLFKSFVNAVYKTANGSDLSAAQIAELRDIGIILK